MMRRFHKGGIALLGLAAVLVVVLVVVFRVVIPPRWPADAILVPRDVATVQQALDRAAPGGIIVLEAHRAPFEGPLIVETPNLTLTSGGRGARIEGEGSEPALAIRADGVVLQGIEIAAESIGLQVQGARCRVEDVVVTATRVGVQLVGARSCEFKDVEVGGGEVGIELVSCGGNTLDGVIVRDASEIGIKVLDSWDNRFIGVVVADVPIGVTLEQGSTDNELVECRIERTAIVGVEIRGSNDNLLLDSVLEAARIGVILESVSGCEVRDCVIQHPVVAGIFLQQASQNRVVESAVEFSEDVGILLSQSDENALSYNKITQCVGAGIRLDGGDRNLFVGNTLVENAVGIQADRSNRGRVLRNHFVGNEGIGLFFSGGQASQFLDNRVQGGELGIVLTGSSENTVLRNWIGGQRAIGLSLLNRAQANYIADNQISECDIGILIAASAREDVLSNGLTRNEVGVLLVRSGLEVRIEGNAFVKNAFGIWQDDIATRVEASTGLLMITLDEGNDGQVSPIVTNNRFAWNDPLDLLNESSVSLFAARNWWGPRGERTPTAAAVSGDVSLEESGWVGTVAVGTESGSVPEILGRALQYALSGRGFRVIDLVGMGGSSRVQEALRMCDVDLIWWGSPDSSLPVFSGETVDVTHFLIPADAGWIMVVSSVLAERLAEPTISALAAAVAASGERLRVTAPRTFGAEELEGVLESYNLRDSLGAVEWTGSLEEAEALLKFGTADVSIVQNLEETLTRSGFVPLEDDRSVLGSKEVAVVLREELLTRFPEIKDLLVDLVQRLSQAAIHGLNSRVRLLHRAPEDVAREFLLQEGILTE